MKRGLVVAFVAVLAAAALLGCGAGIQPEMIIEATENRPMPLPPDDFRVAEGSVAVIETDMGRIVVQLFPEKAPAASTRFAWLAARGFYDSVIFYRVMKDRLVQTGDPVGDGYGGLQWPGELELSDLRQEKGSVVMARASDPSTFNGHFYICIDAFPEREGQHTVFGKVLSGLDVAAEISRVETDDYYGRPLNPVMMRSVRIVPRGEAGL